MLVVLGLGQVERRPGREGLVQESVGVLRSRRDDNSTPERWQRVAPPPCVCQMCIWRGPMHTDQKVYVYVYMHKKLSLGKVIVRPFGCKYG
jgi:hypothetical protein